MTIFCQACGRQVTTWRSTTVHGLELETETINWLCQCGQDGSRTMITIDVHEVL